jgi:phenylacetate-CoA ligase
MPGRYWQPEIECAPLAELVARLAARLASDDLLPRAMRSPLYRARWQAAGVDPLAIRSVADLQRVPFTGPADLRQAQAAHHPDEFVCSAQRPRYWYSTSGSTGVPKWIPVSGADLELAREVGYRGSYLDSELTRPGDVAFGVSAPAPFISDALLWPALINELRGIGPQDVAPVEAVTFSFESGVEGVAMAIKRKATMFLAFPSLVMRIAEGITENAGKIARQQLRAHFSVFNLLAYGLTWVLKVKARYVMPVRVGIFAGEPLAPYRQALTDAWGLKQAYNSYTFTEFGIGSTECWAHEGLHLWLDPRGARPWGAAAAGDEGELVITHWGDAFPLVRWRTSDLVRVVSTAPCRCGRTHPRIEVLQRSDDLVNLGIIRFSTFTLKEHLDAVQQPAAVARWQLRVGRRGYKPLLTVLVKPAGPADEHAMREAVKAAILRLEVLRMGSENGLVCEPVVEISPDLGDRLSSSGKFRPLVYETDGQEQPR